MTRRELHHQAHYVFFSIPWCTLGRLDIACLTEKAASELLAALAELSGGRPGKKEIGPQVAAPPAPSAPESAPAPAAAAPAAVAAPAPAAAPEPAAAAPQPQAERTAGPSDGGAAGPSVKTAVHLYSLWVGSHRAPVQVLAVPEEAGIARAAKAAIDDARGRREDGPGHDWFAEGRADEGGLGEARRFLAAAGVETLPPGEDACVVWSCDAARHQAVLCEARPHADADTFAPGEAPGGSVALLYYHEHSLAAGGMLALHAGRPPPARSAGAWEAAAVVDVRPPAEGWRVAVILPGDIVHRGQGGLGPGRRAMAAWFFPLKP